MLFLSRGASGALRRSRPAAQLTLRPRVTFPARFCAAAPSFQNKELDANTIYPKVFLAFESQGAVPQDSNSKVLMGLYDIEKLTSEEEGFVNLKQVSEDNPELAAVLADSDIPADTIDPALSLCQQDMMHGDVATVTESGKTVPNVVDILTDPNMLPCMEKTVSPEMQHSFDGYAAQVKKALEGIVNIEEVSSDTPLEDYLNAEVARSKHETAFFVVNLGHVIRKHMQWKALFPRVRPHYAVKCNPDPIILRALFAMGAKFDCASKGEIELAISVGAGPDDIIFANPCKNVTHINFARERGVRRMTFDNEDELNKIASLYPGAECVLRIKPPIEASAQSFSTKFGAGVKESTRLVKLAAKKGINVAGVSFHVGSGCFNTQAYVATIEEARRIFDLSATLGRPMTVLDIGGGWPGSSQGVKVRELDTSAADKAVSAKMTLPEMAETIRPLLDKLFPEGEVDVISEPGRYYVTESGTLAANIIARRANYMTTEKVTEGDKDEEDDVLDAEVSSYLYYISDGVYGTFNAIIFDAMTPTPLVLQQSGRRDLPKTEKKYNSTVFGPTCDSIDVVCRNLEVQELNVGDWLYFTNMGAYTTASGTNFNGFPLPPCRFIIQ